MGYEVYWLDCVCLTAKCNKAIKYWFYSEQIQNFFRFNLAKNINFNAIWNPFTVLRTISQDSKLIEEESKEEVSHSVQT